MADNADLMLSGLIARVRSLIRGIRNDPDDDMQA